MTCRSTNGERGIPVQSLVTSAKRELSRFSKKVKLQPAMRAVFFCTAFHSGRFLAY